MNQGLHHFHSSSAASPRLLMAVLLFLLLLRSPLLANLPYECSTCSGTDEECNCGGDDADEDTPPDSGDDEDVSESPGETEFGSLKFSVAFGRPLHGPLRLGGQFSLYAVSASPVWSK